METGRSVSRKELEGSNWSSDAITDDENLQEAIKQRLGSIDFEFVNPTQEDAGVSDDDVEFRLFAGSKPGEYTKIRIKSPDWNDRPWEFIVPDRPRSYYYRDIITKEQNLQFEKSAITGQDIIACSTITWSGCSLAWRVINGTQSRNVRTKSSLETHVSVDAALPSKRSRTGKKSRIARRKKLATIEAQKQEQESAAALKEAQIREKKTNKNRSQKLKRKEKERAKKAALSASSDGIISNLDEGE